MICLVHLLVISMTLFLGACATVTRTPNLGTDAARGWLRETGDQRLRIDAPGDLSATGHIAATTPQALRLQLEDGRMIEIPLGDPITLRERRRAPGALLGAFAGSGVGLVLGLVLDRALAVSNPDSAGGKERPPLAVPISILGAAMIGGTIGAVIGVERRLEVAPTR